MESHPYKKPPGVGVSSSKSDSSVSVSESKAQASSPTSNLKPPAADSCQFVNAKGGRCRMLRSVDHPFLCVHNARLEDKRQLEQQEIAAKELLADIPDFFSARSVNTFLGNVTKQLVHHRISRLDAIALTYISQSMLNSQLSVERQFNIALDAARREERLDGVFRLKPGTAHVPIPPTASGFREEMKVRTEGDLDAPANDDVEPLPATASEFVDAVTGLRKGANGDRAGEQRSEENIEDIEERAWRR